MIKTWKWLESTRLLQQEAYGFDVKNLAIGARAMSVKDNVLALVDEAMEVLHEVSWKYWAHDEPFVNKEEVLKECVDAAHFLGNILVAVGVTDEEWEDAYQEKQAENRRRQRDGYKVKGK